MPANRIRELVMTDNIICWMVLLSASHGCLYRNPAERKTETNKPSRDFSVTIGFSRTAQVTPHPRLPSPKVPANIGCAKHLEV